MTWILDAIDIDNGDDRNLKEVWIKMAETCLKLKYPRYVSREGEPSANPFSSAVMQDLLILLSAFLQSLRLNHRCLEIGLARALRPLVLSNLQVSVTPRDAFCPDINSRGPLSHSPRRIK